jgi:hypothetical protein
MNAYKDMLDDVVSPITCVSMNHQNQLEQMANGAMFSTRGREKYTLEIGGHVQMAKSDPKAQRKSSLSDCTWLEMSLDLLILKP